MVLSSVRQGCNSDNTENRRRNVSILCRRRRQQQHLVVGVVVMVTTAALISLLGMAPSTVMALSMSSNPSHKSALGSYYFSSQTAVTSSGGLMSTPRALVTETPTAVSADYEAATRSIVSRSRAAVGGSRASYKRFVVGSEGGRPQITALDMVLNGADSSETQQQQFDKNNFEMHVGRALDTLRKDYPHILTQDPDYSIYDPHVEVVDPSGVRVRGLKSYKNAFRVMHALVRILYCPAKSGISMRMCYDQARQNVRIHWNAYVVPRDIFGSLAGVVHTNYVDGISVYEFDRFTGNITEHRIEQLLINDAPVMPKEGVIAALKEKHTVMVPSFIQQSSQQEQQQKQIIPKKHPRGGRTEDLGSSNLVMSFQQMNPIRNFYQFVSTGQRAPSSLFALEATSDDTANSYDAKNHDDAEDRIRSQYPNLDWNAYQGKNKSRKKFGLKPLSPDEFIELELQVQKLASVQQEKMAEQRQTIQDAAAAEQQSKNRQKNGLFQKMFGDVLQSTCESNYDCERPEVCCDFGFQKRCCFSGTPVGAARWDQMQPIRVPADTQNYPPNLPPENNGNYPNYY